MTLRAGLIALLFLIATGAASIGYAEPVVVVDGSRPTVQLAPRTILVDPNGSLLPSEAARQLLDPASEVETAPHSRGYVAYTLWARIAIDVTPEAAGLWYLSLELPNFDQLDVFLVPSTTGPPVAFTSLGDRVPETTDVHTRFHIAPIDLPTGRTVLLVRGKTGSTMTLDMKLRQLDHLLAEEQDFFALETFYTGIATVLGLAAIGLFLFLRQWIYLVYVLTLASYTFAWLIATGVGPGHLWPDLAQTFHIDQHFLFAFTIFGTAAFARHFLSSDRVPKFARIGMVIVAAIGLVLALIGPFVPTDQVYRYNAVVGQIIMPSTALLFIATGISLFRGEPAARPLIVTWFALIAAIVLSVLRDAGVVANSPFTLTGPQLGSVFEMVIFAYMLVNRLGSLQREKERVQREALIAAQSHRAELEQRVADRTAELDAAVERERTARQLQQQFVAMVSHDFRTPLAIADAAAQNFSTREPEDLSRLEKIRMAMRRLRGMIDACLIDERVEGGRIQLQVEKTEICELVESTADLLRPAAGNRKFGMILPDDPVMAAVDSRLMEMALSNVLDNAVKYSPDGSTITLSVEEVRNGVEIVIADQGPVIAEAERSRIFEKYYRSDATSQVKGSGLGLHLVRSILEAHDGTATCEPTPEAGNRFILRFPASPKSPGR